MACDDARRVGRRRRRAHRVATERPADCLVTIAPPLRRFDFDRFQRPALPWLVIQGDRDELVDYEAVKSWVASQAVPPGLATVAGAEHFFHGRLHELKALVQGFVSP